MYFKDHFSSVAARYAKARPNYPPTLFAWIAAEAPALRRAWDCATGNGQAARGLVRHFEEVLATDASAKQIAQAAIRRRIKYRVVAAEATDLAPESIDAVTVAQALHWLDRPRFYEVARRALRPRGLVVAWCYGLFRVDTEIDSVVARFYEEALGPYWSPERRLIEERYETIDFPFDEIATPHFVMRRSWTRARLFAYIETWSAVHRYRMQTNRDPLLFIRSDIERHWPDDGRRYVHWPLYLRAGFV